MVTRRGIALLPVLWMVVTVGTLVLMNSVAATDATRAARNRVLLRHADWARNGCIAHLRAAARGRSDDVEGPQEMLTTLAAKAVDAADERFRCTIAVRDNGAVLNVNTADSATLDCALGRRAAQAIIAARPLPVANALPFLLRQPEGDLPSWVGVDGANVFNINTAPLAWLHCAPGVRDDVLQTVARLRREGIWLSSLSELSPLLPPLAASRLFGELAVSTTRLATASPSYDVIVTGRAGNPAINSEQVLHLTVRGDVIDFLGADLP